MSARSITLATSILTLALLGSGCSSDSDTSADTVAATATPSTEGSVETVAATGVPTTDTPTTQAPTTSSAPSTTEVPEPFQVLVTNDDGFDAPGIDAVVQALQAFEGAPIEITVVAPATPQSGQGGNETGGPLTATDATTASGFPAKAVAGFPADAMIWALDQGGIDFVPDLVISGSNSGQNLGPVVDASGTVGAARAAARRNVPAIAVSAGLADNIDFQPSIDALLVYLDENLDTILSHEPGAPVDTVISINAPTCAVGVVRGAVNVPLAVDLQGYDYAGPVDCTSTLENPADDVQAFFNGFVAVSPTPLAPAGG